MIRIMTIGLVFVLAQFGPAQAATRIGVASTVVNNVTASAGAAARKLKTGDAVYQNQAVSAAANSRAQLLFKDETVFNIGPNSRVVLDRFVYNPRARAGSVVMSVTKGAFRFISGSADPKSYLIKTPLATIAVRGTIINGRLFGASAMNLNLKQGAMLICPLRKAVLNKPIPREKRRRLGNLICALADQLGQYVISLGGATPGGGNPGNNDPVINDVIDELDDPFGGGGNDCEVCEFE
jgi:hypothetical protein